MTREHGALLIFDEVVTGFRVGAGGAQGLFGVLPDLTCLGKVIGGGLPVAAYGGRAEIMEMVAPSGPVYQAGTLSGNPLAMAAGIVTLRTLLQSGAYDKLEALGARLQEGLERVASEAEIDLRLSRLRVDVHPLLQSGRGQGLRLGPGLRHGALRAVFPRHAGRRVLPGAVPV